MGEQLMEILHDFFVNRQMLLYFIMIKVLRVAVAAAIITSVIFLLRHLFKKFMKGRGELCYPLWLILLSAPFFIRFRLFNMSTTWEQYFLNHQAEDGLLARIADCEVIAYIYLAGLALTFGAAFLRNHRLKKALGRMQKVNCLEEWEQAVRITQARRVECVAADCNTTPFSYGICHPYVVLPKDYALRYESGELRMVIVHELNHIRCHDLLVLRIFDIFRRLMWFHPMVIAGARYFKRDMECYCDYRVLRLMDTDAVQYGKAVLKSLTCCAADRHGCGQVTAGILDEKKNLMARIGYIAGDRRRRLGAVRLLCVMLAGVILALCSFVRQNSHNVFTDVNKVIGIEAPSQKTGEGTRCELIISEEDCAKVARVTEDKLIIKGYELGEMLRERGYSGDKIMLNMLLYQKEQHYINTGGVTIDKFELDQNMLEIPLVEEKKDRWFHAFYKYL